MDPISAIGVASSIATFLEIGFKVSQRLVEYNRADQDGLPRFLRSVSIQLPLLLNALSRIKSEESVQGFDTDTRCVLRGVVAGCTTLITDIETLIGKVSRQDGESRSIKLKKVLSSFKYEEKIKSIDMNLQTYIRVLILHHVVDPKEVPTTSTEEVEYFSVREPVAQPFYDRPDMLQRLHIAFHAAARAQSSTPTIVVLIGEGGVGKSQLALNYCHVSKDVKQFQTVFWLNAKDQESLELSFEGVAAILRRSTEGSRSEKLEFVNQFLTKRWHPWLLVLDNYQHDNFPQQNVLHMLPTSGYGAILITTRSKTASILGQPLDVLRFRTTEEDEHLREVLEEAIDSSKIDRIRRVVTQGYNVNNVNTNGQPFLAEAALKGLEAAVELLLEQGAHLDPKPQMESPLECAASSGSDSVVAHLLNHEDKLATRLVQERYQSAMCKALEDGHVEVARILISRRQVTIDILSHDGGPMFCKAAKRGYQEILTFYFENDVVPKEDQERGRALQEAAGYGHLDVLKYLISEKRFDPNLDNGYGLTALVAATSESLKRETRESIVRFLLDAGADPNLPWEKCGTSPPIQWAVSSITTHASIVQMLLDAGADPTRDDGDGDTPLRKAVRRHSWEMVQMLLGAKALGVEKRKACWNQFLQHAVDWGDRDLVFRALKAVGPEGNVDINIRDEEGNTPLMQSIRKEEVSIARILLRHGADQQIPNSRGRLPLSVAAENGLELVVRDLLKSDGSPRPDSARTERGNTPLHLAVTRGHEKVVKLLFDANADKDDMNEYGETPVDIAEQMGLERIVKILAGTALEDLGATHPQAHVSPEIDPRTGHALPSFEPPGGIPHAGHFPSALRPPGMRPYFPQNYYPGRVL